MFRTIDDTCFFEEISTKFRIQHLKCCILLSFATICDPTPNSASAVKINNLLNRLDLGGYKNGV